MGDVGGHPCEPLKLCDEDPIYHLLKNLKQRFDSRSQGKPLVHDVRYEAVRRFVPKRNITAEEIEKRFKSYIKIARDTTADIYKFAPEIHKILEFPSYSRYQVYGWRFVYDALENNTSVIITAPTGSGKTEVFVPPLVYKIIENLKKKEDYMALIVYPRISLLRDQASRIFKYVYKAQQTFNCQHITIGLQFGGIATQIDNTLNSSSIFNNRIFQMFNCPICNVGNLKFEKRGRRGHFLECTNCNAEWRVSLAKDEHVKQKVNILITTFESLDRLFLHPKFTELFSRLNSIFVDEVHLFHGIYGAHISNFIENIEIVKGDEVAKIGISATIAAPEYFGSKLFYKAKEPKKEKLFTLKAEKAEEFELEEKGCELIYFIKSTSEEDRSLDTSCFIQTVMAVGHGVLEKEQQALAFVDSIDLVKRFKSQIDDAELRKELWKFRTITGEINFESLVCPRTNPCNCEIYKVGECWRALNSKPVCYEDKEQILKSEALKISTVSSQSYSDDWLKADIVLTTPSLEVGIDIDTIISTLHYRAPRTVFSFVQRRGRAGRRTDKAFTFVVLGNTSMDNFFFYKRHRLLDESRYYLPLNPYNEVIKKMHDKLIDHREKIVKLFEQEGESAQQVIRKYITEFLTKCSLVKDEYADVIRNFETLENFEEFRREFKDWVEKEKSALEDIFNTEYILKDLEESSPDNKELLKKITELREVIRKGEYSRIDEIKESISQILLTIEQEKLNLEGREAYREFQINIVHKLEDKLDRVKGQQAISESILNRIENYYLFFKTLHDKLEMGNISNWSWKFNSIPDVVKAFFQASFYLHLGISLDEDKTCLFNDVDFYLPDAFFQEVKPIVIEVNRGYGKYDLVLEDSSFLDFMLIPYKPIHRYSGDTFLNIIDTGVNELENIRKISNSEIELTVPIKTDYIKGIDKEDSFEVSALTVRFLRTDDEGKQALKICPECFNLYSFNKRRPCHGQNLINVRLKAEPVTEKYAEVRDTSDIEETRAFTLAKLNVESRIRGSDVKIYRVNVTDRGIFPTQNLLYELKVRYEKPLSYKLITKGIIWKVSQEFLNEIEAIQEKEKLLHTGAHILLKVVASLGGVHEQVLQYSYDINKGVIKVWERYEGGIGIVDSVFRKIKEDPFAFYKELLSVVLCPIHISDRIKRGDLTLDTLQKDLTHKWYIGEDEELVKEILEEVKQELKLTDREAQDFTCEDGCPVCIHVNYCQSGFDQEEDVSRSLGEKLIKSLLKEKKLDNLEGDDLKLVLARKQDKAILLDL